MSLSEILAPTTGSQNWKNLYVNNINVANPLTQPNFFLNGQQLFSQAIAGGFTGVPIQFPSFTSTGVPAPTNTASRFTVSQPGYYLINFTVCFLNSVGPIADVQLSAWIQKNGTTITTGVQEALSNNMISASRIILSSSSVVFLNNTGDFFEIIGAQSSGAPMNTGDSLFEQARNKINFHYLHA